jgi:hypothetical protein
MKQKFVLDFATWRCGDSPNKDSNTSHGTWPTYLRNGEGFMCCLGQASCQFNPEVKIEDITRIATPQSIGKPIPFLTEVIETRGLKVTKDTDLANKCIKVNDNYETTIPQKIKLLTELFADAGVEMTVINYPDHV